MQCPLCIAAGHIYMAGCDDCYLRWFHRLPRKWKVTQWKARPDMHEAIRRTTSGASQPPLLHTVAAISPTASSISTPTDSPVPASPQGLLL